MYEQHLPPVREVLSILFQSSSQWMPSYLVEVYVARHGSSPAHTVLFEALNGVSQIIKERNGGSAMRVTPQTLYFALNLNLQEKIFPIQIGNTYVETIKVHETKTRPGPGVHEIQPRVLVADALASTAKRNKRRGMPFVFPYLSSGYLRKDGSLAHAMLPNLVLRHDGPDSVDLLELATQVPVVDPSKRFYRVVPTTASFSPASSMLRYDRGGGRAQWAALKKLQDWKGEIELYAIPRGLANTPGSIPELAVCYFRKKNHRDFQLGVAHLKPSDDPMCAWDDPVYFEVTSRSEASAVFGDEWARYPTVALAEQVLFSGLMPSCRDLS